jgi:hypothetical protein
VHGVLWALTASGPLKVASPLSMVAASTQALLELDIAWQTCPGLRSKVNGPRR